jgi:hypothetical protein
MKRVTIFTLLLALISTWIGILLMAFMARQIAPDIVRFYKGIGTIPPLPSRLFLFFMLSSLRYVLPAMASILLVSVEIFVRSERSRFVIQMVYTAVWFVFITLNFVALLLCCWQMLQPI